MQKEIYFDSDTFRLHGTLHLPDAEKPPVVIGSHGLLSTGDSPKQIALAEKCNRNRIAYFRYDHRGCGKSTGDFATATSFDGRCRDLLNAAGVIRNLPETGNQLALFGSSFGGAVSLAMAPSLDISSIVTVAAPLCRDWIQEPYVNDPANTPLLETLNKEKLFFDIRNHLSEIRRLLIFHGDKDSIVPFENALELEKNATAPKVLIRQKTGDHPMSNEIHQKEFMQLAVDWFVKFFACH